MFKPSSVFFSIVTNVGAAVVGEKTMKNRFVPKVVIFFKKASLRQGRSKHRSMKLFREGGAGSSRYARGKRVLLEATSWCGCHSSPALSKLSQALLVFPVPSQHRLLFLRALSLSLSMA